VTVTDAARSLGVSRKTLSSILDGRTGISPEMAVRLSIAFNTSAESWLHQQVQHDLWHAGKNRKSLHVEKWSLPDVICLARTTPPAAGTRQISLSTVLPNLFRRSYDRGRIPRPSAKWLSTGTL
jgi:addiction module HigA family antidote